MEKTFYPGNWQQQRAFSPAVATKGGRIIWLSGHGGLHGATGGPLGGDFGGQVRQAFKNLAATLEKTGSNLAHITTMTAFIIDARYGDQFVDIRKEFFPSGEYPASALITVAGFARPDMMVEIQCVAVAPE